MRVQAGLVQVALLRKITTHFVERVAQAVMTSRRPSLTAVQPSTHVGDGFKHDTWEGRSGGSTLTTSALDRLVSAALTNMQQTRALQAKAPHG